MFDSIGTPELLIILFIVLLLFGTGRVAKIGKELGSAISEFRKGLSEPTKPEQNQDNLSSQPDAQPADHH